MSKTWPGGLIRRTPVTPSPTSAPGMWTLAEASYWVKQGLWPDAGADPQWPYVAMLLSTTAVNGAQNNTFLDSSSNNFTVTRNGNTTQGSASPYNSLWSNFFDGNGDYLTVASNAAFDLGGGDFTIECWFNANSFAAAFGLVSRYSAAPAGWFLRVINATTIRFYRADVASDITVSTMAVGTWYHVAAVRSGTTVTVYLNGSSVGTITGVSNFTDATGTTVQIGRTHTITDDINGYMSNVRVVKGTAVYTSNFTAPAAPLTAITGTSLLTCQSNRFRDASSNNFAITPIGNTSVQDFSPFILPSPGYTASANGGSVYLDGNGDFLTAPNNAAFAFGTGDFTVELWCYLLTYTNGSMFDTRNGDTSTGMSGGIADTNGNLGVYVNPTSYTFTGATVPLNAWTHVAFVRSGGTMRAYINGVGTSTNTVSTNLTDNAFRIAANINATPQCMTGYISNMRVVKGTAVYTANFTPPTAPITAISGTSLLLNGTNAGIFDAATINNMETVGNAQVSTVQSKFGGSSVYFDGSGDWIDIPNNPVNFLGSGDFTVEFWVYGNSWSTLPVLLEYGRNNTGSTPGLEFYVSTSGGKLDVYGGSTTGTLLASYSNLPTTTWTHVAFTRASGSNRLFINGVQSGATATDTTNYTQAFIRIGAFVNGGNSLNGYIDELRITKGVARYTANFTPPGGPFPVY